jgi:F-type H+-transporting ATPase subunit delta
MSFSFRGASAEAVVALTDELASVADSPDQAAKIADDLFTVAVTARGEGALRRFATDASIPTPAKTGLVEQVFGSRVDTGSLAILKAAVARRWTATRDFADALEHLSVVAVVRSVGADSGRLADELFGFGQVVKDNPALRDALSDPARSIDDKAALLDTLIGGKALSATVTLARQALSGSYRTVSTALDAYEKVVADVQGEGVATVRVARPLSDAELQRLSDALVSQYDRAVHLNVVVDPDVIGGIRVEIGDDVIDGTVSSRLHDARRRIAG